MVVVDKERPHGFLEDLACAQEGNRVAVTSSALTQCQQLSVRASFHIANEFECGWSKAGNFIQPRLSASCGIGDANCLAR